jgi:O-antigen/teichoic acid export membrane protein
MKPKKGAARSIIAGAAAISSVSILRLSLQFLSVPILARLLSPEDYGVVAIAMPIVLFAMIIADAGLGSSLVRNEHADTSDWHTCFWLLTAIGVALFLTIALAAPWVAYCFNEPRLSAILISLASIVAIQAIAIVPGASLQRNNRFSVIACSDAFSIILSIGAAIASALLGAGIWALVWQQLVYYGTRTSLTWYFAGFRPIRIFKPKEASEHILFARNLLLANLLSFGSRSADGLMLGKVAGASPLGFYSMAFQFARLPFLLVTGPVQYVLYPHLAAARDNQLRLRDTFLSLTGVLAAIMIPSVSIVAFAHDPVFSLLLSDKWHTAGELFMLIAPATALQPVTALLGTFLMALGRTDMHLRIAKRFALVWSVGILLTVWKGAFSLAICYAVVSLVCSGLSLKESLPLLGCSFKDYLKRLLAPIYWASAGCAWYGVTTAHISLDVLPASLMACLFGGIAVGLSMCAHVPEAYRLWKCSAR